VTDKAPPKKPKRFKPMLDMLNTEAAVNTLAPKTFVDLVGMFSQKAYENGELSVDEYLDIVKPLFGETGEKVTNRIKEYEDELERYATGGRVNFLEGGDTAYNKMVTEAYIKAGGLEATGMDIDKFAEMYFKKFADGGRVDLFLGGNLGGGYSESRKDSGGKQTNVSFGGGGDGGNNNPPPKPKTSVLDKIKAMGTVPLNLIGGLFGNPFDPTKPTQVINTKAQMDYLNYLANQKNEDTGTLSYGDYGTQFNLSDLKDPIAFSTAMTMGGTGFKKADTGDFTYSGGTYDFDGAVPFIDSGGLMGLAYRGGEYLGDKFNPVKLADGGRAQFGIGSLDPDAEFNERVRELMDDGYEFGQAVKKAMEETRKDQGDGTMPKSEKWMRDYFFSGKGGYDDRMSYKEFALGPGQELFKRFGND